VARHQHVRYRASVNTLTGRHFDLQLVLREDLDEAPVRETMFWTMALGGHAYGPPVAPRFGCYRPELGAMSLSYVSDLTAWERIREFTSMGPARIARAAVNNWRKLFIRAIATVFRAWRYGDCRIVPGAVTPSNIVVPEPDFRQGSCVLSLTGWTPYRDTLSLVGPLIQNFYQYTAAHYPWTREYLDLSWIFDSCVEALGVDQAKDFLRRLRQDSKEASLFAASEQLQARLEEYLARLDEAYYVPLPLGCAVDRFIEWRWATPQATAPAREQTVTELCRLYRFDRFPEIARYYFYRHTYFAEHGPEVLAAFGSLLDAMFRQPDIPPTQMVELSDLQAALRDSFDRGVFSRMVFPRAQAAQRLEIATVGDSEHKHVIVRSYISDKQGGCYTVREPFDASEIGQLYRLFFTADFPKIVSEQDRYLVCTDSEEQIVGGMCYQLQEDDVVNLDAVVVTHSLRGRGIGGAMLDDFALRMASRNAKVVKTHFFLRQFCLPRGFRVDRRWGGLVRILAPLEESSAEGSL
jgi:predicted GNAT family acetyltransferase